MLWARIFSSADKGLLFALKYFLKMSSFSLRSFFDGRNSGHCLWWGLCGTLWEFLCRARQIIQSISCSNARVPEIVLCPLLLYATWWRGLLESCFVFDLRRWLWTPMVPFLKDGTYRPVVADVARTPPLKSSLNFKHLRSTVSHHLPDIAMSVTVTIICGDRLLRRGHSVTTSTSFLSRRTNTNRSDGKQWFGGEMNEGVHWSDTIRSRVRLSIVYGISVASVYRLICTNRYCSSMIYWVQTLPMVCSDWLLQPMHYIRGPGASRELLKAVVYNRKCTLWVF